MPRATLSGVAVRNGRTQTYTHIHTQDLKVKGMQFHKLSNVQEPWGDRRQEIVFIGGPCMRERDITKLDSEMRMML